MKSYELFVILLMIGTSIVLINVTTLNGTNQKQFELEGMFYKVTDTNKIANIVEINDKMRIIGIQLLKNCNDTWKNNAKCIYKQLQEKISYTRSINTKDYKVQTPEMTWILEAGNCAEQTTLTASIYMSLGYDTRLRNTKMFNKTNDIVESHVYAEVNPNGTWMPVDTTCSFCDYGEHPRPSLLNNSLIWNIKQ